MSLARFRNEWCRTWDPYFKPGICLQAPATATALSVHGFLQKDDQYDRHFYRYFPPDDPDLEDVEFFGPATWKGIPISTNGVFHIQGKSYTRAFLQISRAEAPPPDHGSWDVEQYGGSITGDVEIENLQMKTVGKEQAEGWRKGKPGVVADG